MDHDQRFKTLIREFFADFLRLFFAVWAERFDLDRVEWPDKEVLPNPPEGSRHLLDMVAKLHAKQPVGEDSENMLALIHIEIESPDRTTELKPRLPSYYVHLRDTYQLPVLPIVIYLKVNLNGVGVDVYAEKFWELEVMKFSYLYVGLPGLDGLEYIKGENYLGVALSALMRLPKDRIIELGREAYRKLTESPLSEQQKHLLLSCLEDYLPLSEGERVEFKRQIANDESPEVRAMAKTFFDDGVEKGIETGERKALQETILRQGTRKFGPPSGDAQSHIHSLSELGQLQDLSDRMIDAKSWDELLQVAKT